MMAREVAYRLPASALVPLPAAAAAVVNCDKFRTRCKARRVVSRSNSNRP